MRAVSLKTQRVIMRYPLINALNLFICIYNLHTLPIGRKNEQKVIAYAFGYTVPTWLVCSILYTTLSGIIPGLDLMMYAMTIYLVPLCMSYGLIHFQMKYVFTNSENDEEVLA